jgi:hypothetical protein
MVRDGVLYKRYEIKDGRTPPMGFEPATGVDPATGKVQGWMPVGLGEEDRWHREAFQGTEEDGTYELCGPKVQGNPEGFETHSLVRHGSEVIADPPHPTFEDIKAWLCSHDYEGIVWHHPDGRMVKAKRKDFQCP